MSKYTDLGVKIRGLISQAADDLIRQNDFVVSSTGFMEMFCIFNIGENFSG